MRDYPDNILWRAVLIAFAQLAVVAAVFVAVYYATRITPKREAELKAQGAAAFDAKVEAAGGWDNWLAKELAEVRHE